jgi:hypothetical protein
MNVKNFKTRRDERVLLEKHVSRKQKLVKMVQKQENQPEKTFKFIIEHMEPEISEWVSIEYKNMILNVGENNLILTGTVLLLFFITFVHYFCCNWFYIMAIGFV